MDAQMLARAAEAAKVVAYGVRAEQLDDPTPCPEYDVRALLGHLMDVAAMSRQAAMKAEDGPPPPFTGDDPAEEFGRRIDRAVHDWRRPEAFEGTTAMGAPDLPAEMAAQMTAVDLVVHGWDLARATGQELGCEPDVAAEVLAFMEKMGDMGREYGAFGPAVPVPPDAPTLDRALGLSGRDPSWRTAG
jgi:uncharacterized protein (TIGR03086 family)